MKIYTSYFYNLRFFTPNMIPISTAISDPKWYHANQGNTHVFKDKRGVINGLRAPVFALPVEEVEKIENMCSKNCLQSPTDCDFLKVYERYLDSLNFDDIMNRLQIFVEKVQSAFPFDGEPIVVLMVHEATSNPCSERHGLQRLFAKHGIEVKEWNKEINYD